VFVVVIKWAVGFGFLRKNLSVFSVVVVVIKWAVGFGLSLNSTIIATN
jgi:hypothetical protein